MTKCRGSKGLNGNEMYKLTKMFAFPLNTPLTNVRHRSIILVLFLTKQ